MVFFCLTSELNFALRGISNPFQLSRLSSPLIILWLALIDKTDAVSMGKPQTPGHTRHPHSIQLSMTLFFTADVIRAAFPSPLFPPKGETIKSPAERHTLRGNPRLISSHSLT